MQEKLRKLKAKECVHDLMFTCSCGAYEFGHSYYSENCGDFNATSFDITVEITEADIFELEVPEHSERDSLNWWNEFSSWKRKRNDN